MNCKVSHPGTGSLCYMYVAVVNEGAARTITPMLRWMGSSSETVYIRSEYKEVSENVNFDCGVRIVKLNGRRQQRRLLNYIFISFVSWGFSCISDGGVAGVYIHNGMFKYVFRWRFSFVSVFFWDWFVGKMTSLDVMQWFFVNCFSFLPLLLVNEALILQL